MHIEIKCWSCDSCSWTLCWMYSTIMWKQFSQNTALYTTHMISRCGYFLNGSVLIVACILSFIVWMYISTSGSCLLHVVMFSVICLLFQLLLLAFKNWASPKKDVSYTEPSIISTVNNFSQYWIIRSWSILPK